MNFIIFGCFFSFRILNYVFREFFGDLKGGFFFFSIRDGEILKVWV